jgi:transposase
MRQAGLAVELLETRHVRNAFKIMPVKTDRKDARGIAELMRLGWFRPVHCKSMEAQELRAIARTDTRTRLLMTTPGVGVIVALTFACAIDDPSRFKSSKAVGAYFGMTPTRYQSGETDYSGPISRNRDGSVRTVLYEAGDLILTRPLKGCTALKSWAMRIANRRAFGRGQDASLPEAKVPKPGRWIRSGRKQWRMAQTTRPSLTDLSSSNPIRWRPRADPEQKHDPG